MKMIHGMFDFNGNGKIENFERAGTFMLFQKMQEKWEKENQKDQQTEEEDT